MKKFISPRHFALFAGAGFLAVGLAACGGDDDDEGGSGGGTGTDEGYVAAICDALIGLQDDFEDIIADASGDESEEEAAELLLGPLENYLDALKDANPPADVADYHDEVVATTEEAVNRVRDDNDLSAFDELGTPEEPPQEIQDRLDAIADADPDCQDADFSFGS